MLLQGDGDAAAGPSSTRCAPSGAASAGPQQPVCCSRLEPCWWSSTQGPAPGKKSPSLLVDERLCDACTSAFGAICSSPCVELALAVAETASADCATALHPQPGLSACHRRATASQSVLPERHTATDVLDPPDVLEGGPGGSEAGSDEGSDVASLVSWAAADGVAFAVLVERAARALHVVHSKRSFSAWIEIDK